MTTPRVSVIVVSRNRPTALRRCINGLSQLFYTNFEIVVVADMDGFEELVGRGYQGRIKLVRFDIPNISMARNVGLQNAAGDIVAFIDDDAVPEPRWLDHLIAPIASGDAVAAGGYVLGRNGISLQWPARSVNCEGRTQLLTIEGDETVVVRGEKSEAIKTEGTNMAFDREFVCKLGGFDPAYQFYMDETDLNLRIAAAGGDTAIVPKAVVHHGYHSSERRRADRAPMSLFHTGRSIAVFLRKHAPEDIRGRLHRFHRKEQENGAIKHLIEGRIEPRDVRRLMKTYDVGADEGHLARPQDLQPIGASEQPYLTFEAETKPMGHISMNARWYNYSQIHQKAVEARDDGHRITILRYSLTALRHRVKFTDEGIWLQQGGLFGKSERSDPAFRIWTKRARNVRELQRIEALRT
ncbi:glycosyltransferase family 2 protein [Marivivens aquimaris]|uniref:glycosyltransferase family 2 protein n=1 Tax=Marivivens aquimaris TaxID=2774876 RepID=UPI0018821E19|nr:glycosyltransferase family 2 protein [Marivivens aquimaris]